MAPGRRAPTPTLVLLVRHGATATTGRELPAEGRGPGLSDAGSAQAEAVARHIASWRTSMPALSGIYASPLTRALETAAVMAGVLDLETTEEPGLVDCDAGEWSGTSLKELNKRPEWPTVMHYPSGFAFPGGESLREMQTRAVSAVHILASRHPGQSIVTVSHADPIKAVVADALGLHLDLFQRLIVSPASLSAIFYSGDGPRVLAVNWTASSPLQLSGLTKVGRARPARPSGQ
ncbi:MAG TPA: histidine phosphatase family protein [Acidimicrobiales bacterium]|nr:histidine phosphatase family protein [Acidimicrobiales bacterium]